MTYERYKLLVVVALQREFTLSADVATTFSREKESIIRRSHAMKRRPTDAAGRIVLAEYKEIPF